MDKRIIMPAVCALIVLLLAAAYASLFLMVPVPPLFKGLIGIVLAALAAALIYVILQRNNELKDEDEDDLGKY